MNCWSSADSHAPSLRSDGNTEQCRGEVCKGSAHVLLESCFRSFERQRPSSVSLDTFGVRTARSISMRVDVLSLHSEGTAMLHSSRVYFSKGAEKPW